MKTWRKIAAAALALGLAADARTAEGAAPIKEVPVTGPRVHLAEVVPQVPASLASADLGPAPAPGASRLFTQEELRKAAAGAGAKVLGSLPAAVRVVRKMKRLGAADLDRECRKAVTAAGLRRGVTLAAVRAPKSADVADGWTSVTAVVPKPPRRTGKLPTTASLTFQRGAEVLARISVPIDLDLGAEAAVPDVAKGASLTVTVQVGLVEISTAALASADADVGEELLVALRPSGKVLRVTLTAKDKAVVVAPASPSPPADAAPEPATTTLAAAAPAPAPAPTPVGVSDPVTIAAPAPSPAPARSATPVAGVAP